MTPPCHKDAAPSEGAVKRAWAIIDQCGHFDEAGCYVCIARGLEMHAPVPPAPPAEVDAALAMWMERHSDGGRFLLPSTQWGDLLATVTALVDAQAARHADCCVDRDERDQAVATAVAQERERCAQIADRRCDFACAGTPSAIRQAPRP